MEEVPLGDEDDVGGVSWGVGRIGAVEEGGNCGEGALYVDAMDFGVPGVGGPFVFKVDARDV
jgi:hypothetical protein